VAEPVRWSNIRIRTGLLRRRQSFHRCSARTGSLHLAGRFSIEQVVGVDSVHREVVAGVALPVGENGLIAESRVCACASQKSA